MHKTSLFITIIALIAACSGPEISVTSDNAAAETKVEKDGVFIHISHGTDDPHRICMALSMAVKMAEDMDVLVYFDIKGIEAVLKDGPDITYATFPGSLEQIKKLLDTGVGLYACPGCLKAAGKSPDDLMQGIQVAEKDKFFSFTKGRILTIDY